MNKKTKFHPRPRLLAALCSLGLLSQSVSAAWLKAYGTAGDETAGVLIKADQGGYYLHGTLKQNQAQSLDLLARLNEQGQLQWAKKISGALSVFPASDGSLSILPNNSSQPVWARGKVDPQTGAIAVTSAKTISAANGTLFLGGAGDDQFIHGTVTAAGGDGTDTAIAKLDANGNVAWSHLFDFNDWDTSATIDKAGSGYLFSETVLDLDPQTSKAKRGLLLAKLDANGNLVAGSPRWLDTSSSLGFASVLADGSVAVTGTYDTGTQSKGPSQFFLVLLDGNLNVLWGKRFFSPNGTESFTNYFVAQLADGTLEIAPTRAIEDAAGKTTEQHPGLLRLSKQGNILFNREVLVTTLDDGFLFKQDDGKYYFSESTAIPPKTDDDGVYGRFGSDLVADWVRVLAGPGSENIGFGDSDGASGYHLSGSTSSWGAGQADLLAGVLNDNGLVPGCPAIQTLTATTFTPNLASADLGWSTTPATLVDRGPFTVSITSTTLNLDVSDVSLAETKICEAASPANAPDITVTPAALDFGAVDPGKTRNLEVTLRNDGNAPLQITGIFDPAAPFKKQADNCSGKTIAAGQSCAVTFRFAPTASGAAAGQSALASNDPDENPFILNLTGTASGGGDGGTVPRIDLADVGAGARITLGGQGFGNAKGKIKVGKTAAKIVSWSDATLAFQLPSVKAGTYPVSVTTKNRATLTAPAVTVHTPEPAALSNAAGAKGSTLTLTGRYFGAAKPKVFFAAGSKKKPAKVLAGYGDTRIQVIVPGLKPGQYQIYVSNTTGIGPQRLDFTVQ